MKLILDVEETKAVFLLELLQNFRFVKTRPLTAENAQLLEELQEAVDYVNQIKKQNFVPKPIAQLFHELQNSNDSSI